MKHEKSKEIGHSIFVCISSTVACILQFLSHYLDDLVPINGISLIGTGSSRSLPYLPKCFYHVFTFTQGWYYIGNTGISHSGLAGAEIPPPVASIHRHWAHHPGVHGIRLCRVSGRLEGAETRETKGTSAKIVTVCIVKIWRIM